MATKNTTPALKQGEDKPVPKAQNTQPVEKETSPQAKRAYKIGTNITVEEH